MLGSGGCEHSLQQDPGVSPLQGHPAGEEHLGGVNSSLSALHNLS